jgi:hypothetical protein
MCGVGAGDWPAGNFYCGRVEFDSMTADGTILTVPTQFAAGDANNADTACYLIAKGHRDPFGKDLGYETVGVLDVDGGNAAACAVTDN